MSTDTRNRLNGHARSEGLEVLVDANGESPAPHPKKNSERGSDGRFLRGNQGGPGNPFARKQAALRRAFLGAIDEQEMRELARMVYTRALEGDPAFAKLLLQYLVGRPTPFIDPDTLDVQEWQIHQDYQARQQEMETILDGTPVNYLLDLLEPIKEERLRKNFTILREGIKALDARDAKKSRQRNSKKTTPTDGNGSNGEPAQTQESAIEEDAVSGICDAAEAAASQGPQQPNSCGAGVSPAVPVESKKRQGSSPAQTRQKVLRKSKSADGNGSNGDRKGRAQARQRAIDRMIEAENEFEQLAIMMTASMEKAGLAERFQERLKMCLAPDDYGHNGKPDENPNKHIQA